MRAGEQLDTFVISHVRAHVVSSARRRHAIRLAQAARMRSVAFSGRERLTVKAESREQRNRCDHQGMGKGWV